ncbi:unnamed protein product [Amoebophrya sp. A25]|nr:unnamed protein product [Amoebophrya sp. A25]|eukprot:GSA25T00011268001.1
MPKEETEKKSKNPVKGLFNKSKKEANSRTSFVDEQEKTPSSILADAEKSSATAELESGDPHPSAPTSEAKSNKSNFAQSAVGFLQKVGKKKSISPNKQDVSPGTKQEAFDSMHLEGSHTRGIPSSPADGVDGGAQDLAAVQPAGSESIVATARPVVGGRSRMVTGSLEGVLATAGKQEMRSVGETRLQLLGPKIPLPQSSHEQPRSSSPFIYPSPANEHLHPAVGTFNAATSSSSRNTPSPPTEERRSFEVPPFITSMLAVSSPDESGSSSFCLSCDEKKSGALGFVDAAAGQKARTANMPGAATGTTTILDVFDTSSCTSTTKVEKDIIVAARDKLDASLEGKAIWNKLPSEISSAHQGQRHPVVSSSPATASKNPFADAPLVSTPPSAAASCNRHWQHLLQPTSQEASQINASTTSSTKIVGSTRGPNGQQFGGSSSSTGKNYSQANQVATAGTSSSLINSRATGPGPGGPSCSSPLQPAQDSMYAQAQTLLSSSFLSASFDRSRIYPGGRGVAGSHGGPGGTIQFGDGPGNLTDVSCLSQISVPLDAWRSRLSMTSSVATDILHTNRDAVLTPCSVFNNTPGVTPGITPRYFTPRYNGASTSSVNGGNMLAASSSLTSLLGGDRGGSGGLASSASTLGTAPGRLSGGDLPAGSGSAPSGSTGASARNKRNNFLSYGCSSQSLELSPDERSIDFLSRSFLHAGGSSSAADHSTGSGGR